jgi:hypothetical protein
MALGRLQAMLMELAPGEPLMSRDNLAAMQTDNIASGCCLGWTRWALRPRRCRPWHRCTCAPGA